MRLSFQGGITSPYPDRRREIAGGRVGGSIAAQAESAPKSSDASLPSGRIGRKADGRSCAGTICEGGEERAPPVSGPLPPMNGKRGRISKEAKQTDRVGHPDIDAFEAVMASG